MDTFTTASSHHAHSRQPMRVLLIEDEVAYANLVKILLTADPDFSCEVATSTSLGEGLAMMREHDFEAVLLDLNLTDSSGLATLRKLLLAFPNSNVIVLTGAADEQGPQALKTGAQDYLVKGEYEPHQLVRALRFSMERKSIMTRLEDAQRLAKIGTWVYRPDEAYFYASELIYDFFQLDFSATEVAFQDVTYPEHPMNQLLSRIWQWKATEDIHRENIRFQTSEGAVRFGTLTTRMLNPNHFVGTLQDITLERRAEELEREKTLAEREAAIKERVLANVSHELRTPMNAIVGMSNLLAKSPLPPQQLEYVAAIKDASDVLLGIINDILLASSLQQGVLSAVREPFDLGQTMHRLCKVLSPKAIEKGLEASCEIGDNLPKIVLGDKQRISQVMYNLLGNAIKFTDKGKISLRIHSSPEATHDRKHRIQFVVEDTGAGISPSFSSHIFEAFSREGNHTNGTEGTGLGLSIAKQLVELMGGDLDFRSVEGQGSTFYFNLTLEEGAAAIEQTNQLVTTATSAPPLPMPQQILVVEDHRMNQIVIQRTLEQFWPNAQITILDNGLKALDWLENNSPEIILMDLQMPDLDGYATFKAMQSQHPEKIQRCVNLLLTAQPIAADDSAFVASGFDDFMLKPFDADLLLVKINQHLLNKGREIIDSQF